MIIESEIPPKNNVNAVYRGLIVVAVLIAFSVIESKMIPWGIGFSVLFPLVISYISLGGSLAVLKSDSLKTSAIYGTVFGFIVFSILHSWLFAVGYYDKGYGYGFAKFLLNVGSIIIAAVVVKELSSLFKIDHDEPKNSK